MPAQAPSEEPVTARFRVRRGDRCPASAGSMPVRLPGVPTQQTGKFSERYGTRNLAHLAELADQLEGVGDQDGVFSRLARPGEPNASDAPARHQRRHQQGQLETGTTARPWRSGAAAITPRWAGRQRQAKAAIRSAPSRRCTRCPSRAARPSDCRRGGCCYRNLPRARSAVRWSCGR